MLSVSLSPLVVIWRILIHCQSNAGILYMVISSSTFHCKPKSCTLNRWFFEISNFLKKLVKLFLFGMDLSSKSCEIWQKKIYTISTILFWIIQNLFCAIIWIWKIVYVIMKMLNIIYLPLAALFQFHWIPPWIVYYFCHLSPLMPEASRIPGLLGLVY